MRLEEIRFDCNDTSLQLNVDKCNVGSYNLTDKLQETENLITRPFILF